MKAFYASTFNDENITELLSNQRKISKKYRLYYETYFHRSEFFTTVLPHVVCYGILKWHSNWFPNIEGLNWDFLGYSPLATTIVKVSSIVRKYPEKGECLSTQFRWFFCSRICQVRIMLFLIIVNLKCLKKNQPSRNRLYW